MPLSDYEKRVLDEIECELLADRALASRMRPASRSRVVRIAKATLQFLCGMSLMVITMALFPRETVALLTLPLLGFVAAFCAAVRLVTGRRITAHLCESIAPR